MPGTQDDAPSQPWHQVVVLLLAVLVVAHSVVIALWLAPSSPLRSAASPDLLNRYVDPYFRQSWQSLDPSHQRVDERLRIRAKIADGDGDLRVTPWIDVTAEDLDATRHSLAPPRVRLIGRRLATNLNASYLGLSDDARAVAKKNFTQERDSADRLRSALREVDTPVGARLRYVNNDRMTVRFASLYATAVWGTDVEQVQYSSGRRFAPSYAERDEKTIADTEFTKAAFGWRRIIRPPAAAQDRFDDYLKAR